MLVRQAGDLLILNLEGDFLISKQHAIRIDKAKGISIFFLDRIHEHIPPRKKWKLFGGLLQIRKELRTPFRGIHHNPIYHSQLTIGPIPGIKSECSFVLFIGNFNFAILHRLLRDNGHKAIRSGRHEVNALLFLIEDP